MKFQGIITALITPFKNNKIDYTSLEKLLHMQIEAGVNGVVIGGSTGEGSTLFEEEYFELIRKSVEISNSKVKIIAGMTAAGTDIARAKIVKLNDIAIDGIMCTVPHYVKPEQSGIYEHFSEINKASKKPIMLYVHPGRTGCDMSDDVIIKLSKLDNITSIKDASDDLEKPLRLLPLVDKEFNFLTGDDSRMLAYCANGGVGAVSVSSNLFPKICVKINNLQAKGNILEAQKLQQKLITLTSCLFNESNPIGVKCAARILSLCDGSLRKPLTVSTEANAKLVEDKVSILLEIENNV